MGLKSKIQQILSRYPRINCLQRVLRHVGDKNYAYKVLNVDYTPPFLHWVDPRCLYIEHLGKRYPEEIIYLFKETEAIGGFFAQHRRLLLALAFAESYGMHPVVYYGKDYRYHEDEPIRGTINGFEYYYIQPEGISYEEALASSNLVRFTPCHLAMFNNGNFSYYDVSEKEIKLLAKMQKKYIKLQPEVEKEIFHDVNELLKGKRTLGVHIRGTDFKLGLANHPIPVETEEQIKNVKAALKEKHFEQVFLATDEQETIKEFKKAFGSKVVFYTDTYRSENETATQYSISARKFHQYRLGIEVLRDMYTLSACKGLIAGLSQVSFAARITKLANGEEYEYLKVVSKGKYKENSSHALEVIDQYKEDGRIPVEVK